MEKKNKKIIIICAAVAAVLVIAAAIYYKTSQGRSATSDNNTDTAAQTELHTSEPEKSNKPAIESTEQAKQQDKTESSSSENVETNADDKVYTPTFMYFISSADEGYAETNKMIERLKKEYDGKVNFDIKNIDEDPEVVDNFPVKDQTPELIMLNTKNDICAILPLCNDEKQLKDAIEAAMEK